MGTAAMRVLVEWVDGERQWTTRGVSDDVIQVSAGCHPAGTAACGGAGEKSLPSMYGHCSRVNVVTCFGSPPTSFDASKGHIYDIADYRGPADHDEAEMGDRGAASGRAVHHQRERGLVLGGPGELENGPPLCSLSRGLSGADAVRTLTQLAIFPFTVLYLLLWAGWANAKRWLRTSGNNSD
jgi:hypothetical protein